MKKVKKKIATFVSKGDELIPVDLGEIGERYVSGESLEALAEEICIPHITLGRYLSDAGLLVPELNSKEGHGEPEGPESQTGEVEFKELPTEQPNRRPWVHLSRAARKDLILEGIPHDEVIRRYRDDGESLGSILYDIRKQGVYATEYFLKEVLTMHGVPLRRRR